jgi:5'-3' exoribonuclease 1
MNQQRSRRFRSAKEAEVNIAEIMARQNAAASGQRVEDPDTGLDNPKRFDSNCITPGTDFMLKLSLALQKWVEFKMATDVFWQLNGAQVIVSGPDVPGEGEHKVMDFIRESKAAVLSGAASDEQARWWQPQRTHVLYGLDADLIMLGLVTHEPNFMLLREKMSVVMAGRGRSKYRKKKDMLDYTVNDFEVLELSAFRQMLAIQFRSFADPGRLKVEYDLERIIDDFVFMCMLVGNDFLPHVPHLEIDSGALSLMMSTYIDLLQQWGGYLTKKEKINPERFEQFIYNLAAYEEEHFKRRSSEENEIGWSLSAFEETEDEDFYGLYYSGLPTPAAARAANKKASTVDEENARLPPFEDRDYPPSGNRGFRRAHPTIKARSYRDFYYATKLGWPLTDRSRTLFRRRAHVRDFLEGLHWNLHYYHNGCMSWDWFFPFFYAPLSSDYVNLSEFYDQVDKDGYGTFSFPPSEPIPSLAQLLSVLPPQSSELLPKPLAELMLHPSSPLAQFYPPDFTVDPNGKRQSWEAIVQIPFIDSEQLLYTVQKILDADLEGKDLLSNSERRRNARGRQHVFTPPAATQDGVEVLSNGAPRIMKRKTPPEKLTSASPLRKKGEKKVPARSLSRTIRPELES